MPASEKRHSAGWRESLEEGSGADVSPAPRKGCAGGRGILPAPAECSRRYDPEYNSDRSVPVSGGSSSPYEGDEPLTQTGSGVS